VLSPQLSSLQPVKSLEEFATTVAELLDRFQSASETSLLNLLKYRVRGGQDHHQNKGRGREGGRENEEERKSGSGEKKRGRKGNPLCSSISSLDRSIDQINRFQGTVLCLRCRWSSRCCGRRLPSSSSSLKSPSHCCMRPSSGWSAGG
jgi:hypothetical protein